MEIKRYRYEEWTCTDESLPEDRTYTDLNNNPLSGILEGFYRFKNTKLSDDINSKYVEGGKIKC